MNLVLNSRAGQKTSSPMTSWRENVWKECCAGAVQKNLAARRVHWVALAPARVAAMVGFEQVLWRCQRRMAQHVFCSYGAKLVLGVAPYLWRYG